MIRFKLLLVLTLILVTAGGGKIAANPVSLRGAGNILGPQTNRALSRLLGVSPTRISTMNAEQRAQLLEERMAILRQQGREELATNVSELFFKITQGERQEVGALKSHLFTGKKPSLQGMLKKSNDILEILRMRVQKGDLSSSAVEKFSTTVQSANKALGFDILGESASSCLKKFSPALVGNFMNLVAALKKTRALKSTQSAFNAMVAQSEKMFGESMVSAQKRICGLAGRGHSCRALAPQMCAL